MGRQAKSLFPVKKKGNREEMQMNRCNTRSHWKRNLCTLKVNFRKKLFIWRKFLNFSRIGSDDVIDSDWFSS